MSSQMATTERAENKERELTYRQAIGEALVQEMSRNPKIFIMGEDVRVFYGGGPFAVTQKEKFLDKFGPERIRDTPISESAFIGAGVMAAVAGFHPVTELMFSDFYGVCMDQIANQGAKLRYMFGGQSKVPLTIRVAYGGGMSFGATHSQTLYSIFAHMPGIKVVAPSTPYDAKGLLTTALREENIVAFFEHKGLYGTKGGVVPEEQYAIPLGRGDIKRVGKDVTLVAVGKMVHVALEAAGSLEKDGISAEVIDPRSLVPFDKETILDSVKRTSRLVIVDEDHSRCGFSAEVAAIAADEAFGILDAPIKRVTTYNVPLPYAKHLEDAVLPSVQRITDAVREIMPS
jgi:pyruvate/2-oxoglutarate/acetoin dehydrogenase E1 component